MKAFVILVIAFLQTIFAQTETVVTHNDTIVLQNETIVILNDTHIFQNETDVSTQDNSTVIDMPFAAAPGGVFVGEHLPQGVKKWTSIPYAKPPVGDLRLRAPVEISSPLGVYFTNYTAPACTQNLTQCDVFSESHFCPDHISEDCLYLGVTAPEEPSSDPNGYPVMIYFHGGSFINGGGSVYNATQYAKSGVIVVTINYRLNVLGFMATDTLEGNYGFLDQRMAMSWVQKNIHAFGGNNKQVTITGQSAGAMSVACHLSSPGSLGLFHRAIMQSNPMFFTYPNRTTAKQNAQFIFDYVNCSLHDDVCIRSKPWEIIVEAFSVMPLQFLPFPPLVERDGIIPQQPYQVIRNGQYPENIPILAGFTRDEGTIFVYESTGPLNSLSEFNKYLAANVGEAVYKKYGIVVNALYPVKKGVDGRIPAAQVFTDYAFVCPLLAASQFATRTQSPIYLYSLNHPFSLGFDAGDSVLKYCVGYVCHGMDLVYTFDLLGTSSVEYYEGTDEEKALVKSVHNSFVNFITHGNPNKGLPITTAEFVNFNLSRRFTQLDTGSSSSISQYTRNLHCALAWDLAGLLGLYPPRIDYTHHA